MIVLRLGKAETEWLREVTDAAAHRDKKAAAILVKLDRAELLAGRKRGISVAAAVEVIKLALGPRTVLPPNPTAAWFAPLSHRLAALGVTVDDVRRAAEAAGRRWNGLIKAESVIRQCDVLLSDAPETLKSDSRGVVEMDEL